MSTCHSHPDSHPLHFTMRIDKDPNSRHIATTLGAERQRRVGGCMLDRIRFVLGNLQFSRGVREERKKFFDPALTLSF